MLASVDHPARPAGKARPVSCGIARVTAAGAVAAFGARRMDPVVVLIDLHDVVVDDAVDAGPVDGRRRVSVAGTPELILPSRVAVSGLVADVKGGVGTAQVGA